MKTIKKPTKSEKDNHTEKYPITIRFRANTKLQEQLEYEARVSGCSPSTWLRQAIRGEIVATSVATKRARVVATNVVTVEEHTKPVKHPDTQRRLNELFPARQIGFATTPTDARSTACEEPSNYPELLDVKPNPRVRFNQPPLAVESNE